MARKPRSPSNRTNVHSLQVETPICHIVPVSRAYPHLPPPRPIENALWPARWGKEGGEERPKKKRMDRVYTMLSEFLIEVKLLEEQEKARLTEGLCRPNCYLVLVNVGDTYFNKCMSRFTQTALLLPLTLSIGDRFAAQNFLVTCLAVSLRH